MTTTSIHRTQITPGIVVSTVMVRVGRERRYETSIIVDGSPCEPLAVMSKEAAGICHDHACDFARGYDNVRGTRSAEHWTRAIAEVRAA